MKNILNKVVVIAACLVLGSLYSNAQPTTDQQLAAFYFQEDDFQKAALYYEKLYLQSNSDFFYSYFLQCLFKLDDFKRAKKVVKNQLKFYPGNTTYQIDLGEVYKAEGEDKKAKKEFNAAIDRLQPVTNNIIALANAFSAAKEYDFALKTYAKGDQLLNGNHPFNIEKAKLFGSLGQYENMFNEYLGLLEITSNYLQSIQNELARNLAFEEGSAQNTILKQTLLQTIQRKPNQNVFYELLTWVFIQEKNYQQALVHTKALDKRTKGEGQRVLNLAGLAKSAKQYDIAIDAYDYIVNIGKGPFYISARVGLLDVLNKKLTSGFYFSPSDAKKLEASYLSTLDELGLNQQTVKVYRDLGHIEAFYLNNPDTAIIIIEKALTLGRISAQEKALTKLELADIYVIQGYIWDASLLYSQFDKDFKYDVLGETAKFKNARISYYMGDFKWAKAQLDVLKGSTAKLISNDAMDLSLLITDNTGIDTTEHPLELFAKADLFLYQHKHNDVNLVLDSITEQYPGHALTDEIYMLKYDLNYKKGAYEQSKVYLEKIIAEHGTDITADDAVFKLGLLYENHFNDTEKAMEYYQKLLLEYSNSMFVIDARKRFRNLRGDFNNLEP